MSIKSIPVASKSRPVKRRKLSHSTDDEHEPRTIDTKPKQESRTIDQPSDQDSHFTSQSRDRPSMNSSKGAANVAPVGPITKSSVLSFQVSELLDQAKVNSDSRLSKSKPLVDRITTILKSAPSRTSSLLSHAEKSLNKQKVTIPFANYRPNADAKYKFGFEAPANVQLCGNLVHGTAIKGHEQLEFVVEMPSSLLQDKDYLNYRAFQKRAFYLACLADVLRQSLHDEYEVKYCLQYGIGLVPVILLVNKSPKEINITVDVAFPASLGPLDKTKPGRNCVRQSSLDEDDASRELPATPFYNSILRLNASKADIEILLKQSAQNCPSFSDACLLGQFWLQQRGFSGSVSDGGFGPFEWNLMTALFLSTGGHKSRPLFSNRYSSVQLFKAMLQVLSSRDFVGEPMTLDGDDLNFRDTGIPLFYSASLGINIFSGMNTGSYFLLKHLATLSLNTVNARDRDNFDAIFIHKAADPVLLFDEVYHINVSAADISGAVLQQALVDELHSVLRRGLGDRVRQLALNTTSSEPWKVTQPAPTMSVPASIQVGVILNAEASNRVMDYGPSVEEPEEAKDFRDFWGDKAELRRFKDGRIVETLVWAPDRPVTYQIIQYLLAFHFKLVPSRLSCRSYDLTKEYLSSSATLTATEAFGAIGNTYQKLASKLHQLEGLPLPIRSISPSHAALRSASQNHPLSPQTARPIDVLIQFDSSTRWPDQLSAIQYTKLAFLAKLADLLVADDDSLATRVGVENTESSGSGYFNTSFLDVTYGVAISTPLASITYRLRIYHDRELHLLQTASNSKALSSNNREMLPTALMINKQNYIASPSHTTTIRNLITHFLPLSATIRLLKCWVSYHNLTNHLPEPALEIVAARVFLQPAPWSVPGSATTAFLRCLHFLSHWDWTSTPLIVDLSLSQDMPSASHKELDTRFQAWRKLDPGMNNVAWFIGTNVDNTGTVWTQSANPARVVAGRITALAKAAIALIRQKSTQMDEQDWKSLFVSSLSDFDFVVHLKATITGVSKGRRANVSSRKSKHKNLEFKNLMVQEELDLDENIGHDVVQLFLNDLQRSFGTSVLFFHGEGGDTISGLWRPTVLGTKEWRVRLGYSTIPLTDGKSANDQHESEASCEINKDSILAEIGILGEGMIEKITVKE